MKIVDQILGMQEKLDKLVDFCNDSAVLADESLNITLNMGTVNAGVLVQVEDNYQKFLSVIRDIRQETGEPMKLKYNWFSCGKMIFDFSCDLITIWFKCLPDEIPPELMPSATCKVEKVSYQPEDDYIITCEVKK